MCFDGVLLILHISKGCLQIPVASQWYVPILTMAIKRGWKIQQFYVALQVPKMAAAQSGTVIHQI